MKVEPGLVHEHFERLLDLSAEQIDLELQRLRSTQPALHAELKALLKADQESAEILDFAGDGDASLELVAGSDFGPYRLEKSLGAGGMGRVYQARRTDGKFEHTVAIKFLTLTASENARNRFRSEIQILARLDHPNIVALFDGGDTPQGIYYIVMQWVDGLPLTQAAESLPLTERLRLVTQLCGAVEYAHQRLIVHRDLKPSNVLLNADGQIKLLDFGISKDLDTDSTQTQAVMTPRYAAPEQILGQPVTTATDIFGLGMLLFELVASKLPPMPETAALGGLVDYARTFVAPPPSQISDHEVPADLDAIVLKCLERDPASRYASVSDLAADLQRFAAGRPTNARNLNRPQKIFRWVGRNRLAVAGLLAAVMLSAGAVSLHLRQLSAERDQAEAALAFVVGLFGQLNPFERSQDEALDIPVADVYQLGLAELASATTLSVQSKGDLALAFSEGLTDVGQFPSAVEAADVALALAASLTTAASDELTTRALLQKAQSLSHMGDAEAEQAALASAAAQPVIQSGRGMLAGQYWSQVGNHNHRNGKIAESVDNHARAVEIILASASSNDDKMTLSQARSDLAWSLNDQGRDQEALEVIDKAVEVAEQLNQSEVALGLIYAKRAAIRNGVLGAGNSDHLRALEITTRVLGPLHRETVAITSNYALSLVRQRDYPAAVEIYLPLIERTQGIENRDPVELAAYYQNLAAAYKGMGDFANSRISAEKSQQIYAVTLAPAHYRNAFPILTLAELALLQGDNQRAHEQANKAAGLLEEFPDDHILRLVARAFRLSAASRLAGCRPQDDLSSPQLEQVLEFFGPERKSTLLLAQVLPMHMCATR